MTKKKGRYEIFTMHRIAHAQNMRILTALLTPALVASRPVGTSKFMAVQGHQTSDPAPTSIWT